MSKSLGNFTSLADLLERSDARAYRLLVLRSHYRSPIEVTPDTIAQAEAGLARLDELARRFDLPDPLADGPVSTAAGGARATGTLDAEAVAASAAGWTTTSTPPGPWPPCSTWPGGPTPPPTPATRRGRRRAAATAGACSARRSACACGRVPTAEVDEATAALVAAPRRGPGGTATGPGPTPSVTSSRRRAGWSRTAPEGTPGPSPMNAV